MVGAPAGGGQVVRERSTEFRAAGKHSATSPSPHVAWQVAGTGGCGGGGATRPGGACTGGDADDMSTTPSEELAVDYEMDEIASPTHLHASLSTGGPSPYCPAVPRLPSLDFAISPVGRCEKE